MSSVAAKLDDFGLPGWIAVTVLAFIVFWPLGLAILVYLFWSGRMSFGSNRGMSRWRRDWNDKMSENMPRWCGPRRHAQYSSGNDAFDEYRQQTMDRLEQEQEEFQEFLKQLRSAKDRTEFDQFMANRRSRSNGNGPNGNGDGPSNDTNGDAPQPQA
ncbi:MAG: DUF2852 domain-containing protein [Pseudomonadota bacterium]